MADVGGMEVGANAHPKVCDCYYVQFQRKESEVSKRYLSCPEKGNFKSVRKTSKVAGLEGKARDRFQEQQKTLKSEREREM